MSKYYINEDDSSSDVMVSDGSENFSDESSTNNNIGTLAIVDSDGNYRSENNIDERARNNNYIDQRNIRSRNVNDQNTNTRNTSTRNVNAQNVNKSNRNVNAQNVNTSNRNVNTQNVNTRNTSTRNVNTQNVNTSTKNVNTRNTSNRNVNAKNVSKYNIKHHKNNDDDNNSNSFRKKAAIVAASIFLLSSTTLAVILPLTLNNSSSQTEVTPSLPIIPDVPVNPPETSKRTVKHVIDSANVNIERDISINSPIKGKPDIEIHPVSMPTSEFFETKYGVEYDYVDVAVSEYHKSIKKDSGYEMEINNYNELGVIKGANSIDGSNTYNHVDGTYFNSVFYFDRIQDVDNPSTDGDVVFEIEYTYKEGGNGHRGIRICPNSGNLEFEDTTYTSAFESQEFYNEYELNNSSYLKASSKKSAGFKLDCDILKLYNLKVTFMASTS
ncbi:MAG: hypothetical protein HRS57_02965 [Mycoplasmataceae bacterium]|nr:hypothetical protein [Mycoplasmataceae bacterium]